MDFLEFLQTFAEKVVNWVWEYKIHALLVFGGIISYLIVKKIFF